MGLKAGWIALFLFVWIIGAFLGSTFEYHDTEASTGQAYTTGTAAFTYGDKTVAGVGTVWVAGMEGGVMKNNTDELWYKIDSVTNNTALELTAVYNGVGGVAAAYTMVASFGWAGSDVENAGGYAQSPITTLDFIFNVSNAVQRIEVLGGIPLVKPNEKYFDAIFKVLTWQWSFMDGYGMIYWLLFAPFVAMGILSMVLLVYGILTGNLSF